MLLEAQIVDVRLVIECPDLQLGEVVSRYLSTAAHLMPATASIEMRIWRSGDEYVLPSGRREPSPRWLRLPLGRRWKKNCRRGWAEGRRR